MFIKKHVSSVVKQFVPELRPVRDDHHRARIVPTCKLTDETWTNDEYRYRRTLMKALHTYADVYLMMIITQALHRFIYVKLHSICIDIVD